jgi:hypothetical protein
MKAHFWAWWVAFAICAWFVPVAAADETPDAKAIERWVQQLDDDAFDVRQAAHQALLKAGKRAIAPLEKAIGRSPEVTYRAFALLKDIGLSSDAEAADLAMKSLERLAGSKDKEIAARARQTDNARQWQIAADFDTAHANVRLTGDNVTSIRCTIAHVEDLDFRRLRRLPHLVELGLGNPRVNDEVIAQLGPLPKLDHLDLFMSQITDASLKRFKAYPSLKSIPMGQTRVTDAGLVHLKEMKQLEYVGLRGDNITDAGLVHLEGLTNLTGLYLGETKVTDAGLVHLKKMTKMNRLYLDHLNITDAGLKHLKGMKNLAQLDLRETKVTKEAVDALREALPKTNILFGKKEDVP